MGDVIVLAVIAAAGGIAVWSLRRDRKKGGCSGCSGCSERCSRCNGCQKAE